jgi:hypothetical protein
MDMMGRVGLIEIPILIAPDQKVWMDRMIKEGKIAIPPGGTLEKGSLYSMFVRMLLHNAMEEQKRQEVLVPQRVRLRSSLAAALLADRFEQLPRKATLRLSLVAA